jgi:hypothetical protein
MRKLFGILFSAVLLLIGSPQGTWAQKVWDLGRTPCNTASGRSVLPRDLMPLLYTCSIAAGVAQTSPVEVCGSSSEVLKTRGSVERVSSFVCLNSNQKRGQFARRPVLFASAARGQEGKRV